MARILGIDYGSRRIGLALSDETETVATPLRVIQYTDEFAALSSIAEAVRESSAALIVMGMPLNMNGTRGPAAERVDAFVAKLKERVGVPIRLWDERMSTVSAERALIAGGARRDRRKQVVDKLAAQIMLQHFLDAQAGTGQVC